MTKVAYNRCYGGFSLSRAAVLKGRQLSGDPKWAGCTIKGDEYDDGTLATDDFGYLNYEFQRTDPVLIRVIEELGPEANGRCAQLAIAEVPAGSRFRIDEYDGNERVMQADDYDWQTA